MRRMLALALVGLAVGASPAQATDPQTRSDLQWAALGTTGGFGLFANLGRSREPTGAGWHHDSTTVAGVSWQSGGFRAAASAGLLGYDYSGAAQGTARMASFALSHDLAVAAGVTLSLELRHSRVWDGASRQDSATARLHWSARF